MSGSANRRQIMIYGFTAVIVILIAAVSSFMSNHKLMMRLFPMHGKVDRIQYVSDHKGWDDHGQVLHRYYVVTYNDGASYGFYHYSAAMAPSNIEYDLRPGVAPYVTYNEVRKPNGKDSVWDSYNITAIYTYKLHVHSKAQLPTKVLPVSHTQLGHGSGLYVIG